MSNPSSLIHSLLTLGCITLLQAISNTSSIFSTCSSLMKQHYGISQAQLNYLVVSSETGRLFGCFSSAAAEYLPAWMILLIGLIFGLIGYGVQYWCIAYQNNSLSYWQVLLLNFLSGNSLCWINTYTHLLASKNFKNHDMTIISLTSSYSWLSGKIYTSLAEAIQGRKGSPNSITYLLLGCLAPTVVGIAMVLLKSCLKFTQYGEVNMVPIIVIVIATGVYTAFESIAPPFTHMSPQLRAVILVLVIMLPLVVALVMAAHWLTLEKWLSQAMTEVSKASNLGRDTKELEIRIDEEREDKEKTKIEGDTKNVVKVGSEHGLKELVMSVDFWLFYWVNACGATVGMVYLSNLEPISKSRGNCEASFLLAIFSAFGFLGRIFLAIFSWYTRETSTLSKPALVVLIMIPMPVAFFLLINDSSICIYISTGILGTCSGAMTGITASTTSEIFGPQNSVIKQTIVLTNIPIGTLLFGYLAALNYDIQGSGHKSHNTTFIIWGSISLVGTNLSFFLHLRTQKVNFHKDHTK